MNPNENYLSIDSSNGKVQPNSKSCDSSNLSLQKSIMNGIDKAFFYEIQGDTLNFYSPNGNSVFQFKRNKKILLWNIQGYWYVDNVYSIRSIQAATIGEQQLSVCNGKLNATYQTDNIDKLQFNITKNDNCEDSGLIQGLKQTKYFRLRDIQMELFNAESQIIMEFAYIGKLKNTNPSNNNSTNTNNTMPGSNNSANNITTDQNNNTNNNASTQDNTNNNSNNNNTFPNSNNTANNTSPISNNTANNTPNSNNTSNNTTPSLNNTANNNNTNNTSPNSNNTSPNSNNTTNNNNSTNSNNTANNTTPNSNNTVNNTVNNNTSPNSNNTGNNTNSSTNNSSNNTGPGFNNTNNNPPGSNVTNNNTSPGSNNSGVVDLNSNSSNNNVIHFPTYDQLCNISSPDASLQGTWTPTKLFTQNLGINTKYYAFSPTKFVYTGKCNNFVYNYATITNVPTMQANQGRFLIDQKSLVKTQSKCDEKDDQKFLNAILASVYFRISNDSQIYASFDDGENSPTLVLRKIQRKE